MKQCGRWPQEACTTMFFLDSEESHERTLHGASAHLDSLVGVFEAPEVSRWQQRHRVVEWRSFERFYCRAGEKDQGAISLVLDLAKPLEHVSLPVVWAWATRFNFHQRSVQFAGCVAEPAAILFGSKWSCMLLCIVLQDALSEVMKVFPPLKPRLQWVISQPSWKG